MVPWKEHLRRFREDRRGITGLETAIVLIAFVVVAATFAFAVLSTGLFSSDKAKQTINAGLEETTGSLELRGPVLAETDGNNTVYTLYLQVANSAGGGAVDLTPGKLTIRYTDPNESDILNKDASDPNLTVSDLPAFEVIPVGNADDDNLAEVGEVYELKIYLCEDLNNDGTITVGGTGNECGADLGQDTVFSLEVTPLRGAALFVQRRTPNTTFDPVLDLQ